MKKRLLPQARRQGLLAVWLVIHTSAGAATVVPGTLINIDFNGDVAGAAPLPTPLTFDGNLEQDEVTAASVAYEDNDAGNWDSWNGWEGTDTHASLANQPQSLADSKGNATPVTVKWSGFTFNYTNYTNGRDDGGGFTNGPNGDGFFCGATAGPGIVTLAGLDPSVAYDIVTIGAGDAVTFTIGDDVRPVDQWHSTNNPSNWEIFGDITPDETGSIVITVTTNGGNFGMGGVQIVAKSASADTDGDGLPDWWEDANGLSKSNPADGAAALNSVTDPDGDGLTNKAEYALGTNPQKADTDEDGLPDGVETKTGVWVSATNTGTDPLKADTDGDGLLDGDENFSSATGTDPNKADTDGDGFSDGFEVARGSDPRDPASIPRHIATAALINVDFNGTGGMGGSTNPVTFDGNLGLDETTNLSVPIEDADSSALDVWNGFDEPNQQEMPLLDSLGQETEVTLSWEGFDGTYTNYLNGRSGNSRTNGPNGDGHLLFNAGTTRNGTVILAGLNPSHRYMVGAIAGGSDPVSFAIGAETQAVAGWNSTTNPANWVVFENVLPNSEGKIILTVLSNGFRNFGIGGVQVTSVGTVADTDGDGLPNEYEDANGLDKNNPADGAAALNAITDPDGDGLTNKAEYALGTNPQKADTDEDGLLDGVETKTGVWVSATNTGTDPLKADTDGDGLADGAENPALADGSDPNKIDTDGDGFSDPAERTHGTNPKEAASTPRQTVGSTLINIDFNGDTGGAAPLPTPITFDGNLEQEGPTQASVAFVDNDGANDLWNGWEEFDSFSALADQDLPLQDSKGGQTNVFVRWSGFTFNYTNYTNGRDSGRGFTNGPNGDGFFCGAAAGPGIVTLGGLDPGKTYHVAAIAAGDPVKFTIGGDERALPIWHSITNPANWVVFQDVAPENSGEIVLTVSSNGGNFGIGGVQIVAASATPPVAGFRITSIARAATGEITLTWESSADKTYTVLWSENLASFTSAVPGHASLPGAAGSMTRTFAPPVAGAPRLFFKVVTP